jgi:hypothetical protein
MPLVGQSVILIGFPRSAAVLAAKAGETPALPVQTDPPLLLENSRLPDAVGVSLGL